ncbi:MAG: hypothetical protein COB35_04895 [Gammaproteobacteria bacterium]|nr:MAG: hypothetical protein COB35_04895 [Gammaproteobacteria bacterium]
MPHYDELCRYAQRLTEAGYGEKGMIINEALHFFDWTKDKFYNQLKKVGWNAGRKKRCDAGTTSQDQAALDLLKAGLRTGVRANGKQIMETPNMASILVANGYKMKSNSTINRLLRQQQATAKQLAKDRPHVQQRSLYPNHVHQVDPSICLLYYPPGCQKGKVQHYASEDEFYANKPANLEKIKHLRVWRYVLTDHFSDVIAVRYFATAGESTAVLYEFLLWCWGVKTGNPFHGTPDILVWDKGSANTSKALAQALPQLHVKPIAHAVKHSRAKGQVEKGNDMVEKLFESRILLEPVNSVAELNTRVKAWQIAYNANTIPGYNSIHGRHKMARFECWQKIMQVNFIAHLKALPDEKLCRYLLSNEPKIRTVKNDLTVTLRHPKAKATLTYDVSDLANIYINLQVSVSPVLMGDSCAALIRVTDFNKQELIHEVLPLAFDEAGFRVDAPVVGENFVQRADTVVDKQAKIADKTAFPNLSDEDIKKAKLKKVQPFSSLPSGGLNSLSHLQNINNPEFISPKGEKISLGELEKKPLKALDSLDLKMRIASELDRPLSKIETNYLDGLQVDESAIETILEQLQVGLEPTPVTKIRIVK